MASYQWTKRETDQFSAKWLRERMSHEWTETAPTVCRRCGVKFSAKSGVLQHARACGKRRRPNRWRMHLDRAILRAKYPREGCPAHLGTPGTAAYYLHQIAEIRHAIKRVAELQPDHPRFAVYWKYHRLARRHRRALRELWRLPSPAPIREDARPDTAGGVLTRQRNELLREARRTQARTIRRGGCVYTIEAGAVVDGALVFHAE